MSALIQSWINDEVQLSRKVTDFNKDFCNGYLFGELLSKFNQQLNFNQFIDSDQRSYKMNNYKLLEPTFKTLGIKFTPQIANLVLHGHPGKAMEVLYQLKMALEKVHNPADIEVLQRTGKLNNIDALKKIPMSKEKYDTMESKLFTKRLNQFNKAQKEVDLDKKLEKFRVIQQKNEAKAHKELQIEANRDKLIKEEMRKIQLNKLQRNITFMEDWEAKGRKEWLKNRQARLAQERKEKEFFEKTLQKTENKAYAQEEAERLEVFGGIDEFEQNTQKQGIEIDHDPDQPKRMEKTNFSVSTTLMKLKDSSLQSDFARKERDKRRRKMIVDQAKTQRDFEIKKREGVLLEKLQQQSKQETEISYEVWRAEQCKQVIIENRKLRDTKYARKKEEHTTVAISKEDNLFSHYRNETARDISQKQLRQKEINVEQKTLKRKTHYNLGLTMFDKIFEIADLCYKHLQDTDTTKIDPRFWTDCCNTFIEDSALIPVKTFRHYDSTMNLTKPDSEEISETLNKLAFADLKEYLTGSGKWKTEIKSDTVRTADTDGVSEGQDWRNNYTLGEVVRSLIEQLYPGPSPIVAPPEVPNYVPLKILPMGYAFSGKKTISKALKEKYNLEVFEMGEMIQEALALNTDFKAIQAEDGGEVPADGENEMKAIGQELMDYLYKGIQPSDDLYVRLVVAKIKQVFPALTHEEVLSEFNEAKINEENRIAGLMGQIDDEVNRRKKKKQNNPTPLEIELTEQLPKRRYYMKGWVLLGFPNNYEQLKALEKALSGFLPKDEQPKSEAEDRVSKAELVVKAPKIEIVPRRLIKSGLDCALVLDVPRDEALRRALGRRLDPTTGIMYHLEDIVPPVDQSPLMERLIPINDGQNSEASLIDRLCGYDKSRNNMEIWLKMFGFEELGINCLQVIDGTGKAEEVQTRVFAHIDRLIEYKISMYESLLEETNLSRQRAIEAEEEAKRLAAEEARMINVDPEVIKEQIAKAEDKGSLRTLSQPMLEYLNKFWETIQDKFLNSTTTVFKNIKNQTNFVVVRTSETQRRFLEVVQKKDDRLLHVLKFQQEYNKFVEEQPDLIEEDQTKEELHQRVEDLHEKLWEMIEAKKEECLAEAKSIMTSGYIEDEMEYFTLNMQRLIQAELDRYFGSIALLNDYYNVIDGKALGDVPENMFPEVLIGSPELFPPIEVAEDPESFPRLELLFTNANKLINGEEVEELVPKDPKAKKQPVPKKDESKKGLPKKGKDEPVVEEKEPTELEKELKRALATEKSIMKYRLLMIKEVAKKRLKELRATAKQLYQKLDDWIFYSVKCENDAVDKITQLFGKAIEKQEKVQKELRLEYVDVFISHKYLNFLTPPPIILPPKEILAPNRFTVTQILLIMKELKCITNEKFQIEDKALLQYFCRKMASQTSVDELPPDWHNKDIKSFQRLVSNLDKNGTGFVSLKSLLNCLCLLATPLPKQEDLDEYKKELLRYSHNDWIDYPKFVTSISFFDIWESCPHAEQNSELFNRVEAVKQLLFHINQDHERDELNVGEFINELEKFKAPALIDELRSPLKSPLKSPMKSPLKLRSSGMKTPGLKRGFSSASTSRETKGPKTFTNALFD